MAPDSGPPQPQPLSPIQSLFVEEFIKIGKDASLFAKEDAWASASSRVIDLIIRLKPEIDAYLSITPFPHLRINDFLASISKSTEALKHVSTFIENYDAALRQKKRESVQKKIEEACASLSHDEKVRYILTKFASEHYRIFEESFSVIRAMDSQERAVTEAAKELARDFVHQLAHENESLPQNILESFLWANSGTWRATLRNLKSFKDHYIWDNFDFHTDEKKGFSIFDFHTHSVTVFSRKPRTEEKGTAEEESLWARKSELEVQAELFESKSKMKKDEKEHKYLLTLLRLPYDYEEDHFDHLSEEEIAEGFVDITQQLQERRLEKEFEIGKEPKEEETETDGGAVDSSAKPKTIVKSTPEIDSALDKVLEEAVSWPAEIISQLVELTPGHKLTLEELEEAWKYLMEAHMVAASLLSTIPWAMRLFELEGRSLVSSNMVKSGSLHVLGHVATTAGLHMGARFGAGILGHVAAGALVSPLALTALPIAVGIGASFLLHSKKSGKSEDKMHVPLNPNAVHIIKQAMAKAGEEKKSDEDTAKSPSETKEAGVEEEKQK